MSYGQAYRPTVNGRKVSAKLASRYHVPQRCQHLFVVDAPADEVFLNLFTPEKLRRRDGEEALADLRQAPGQILSGWSRNDFRWHILEANLRLSGTPRCSGEDLMLVMGLSESVCLPLEIWSEGSRRSHRGDSTFASGRLGMVQCGPSYREKALNYPGCWRDWCRGGDHQEPQINQLAESSNDRGCARQRETQCRGVQPGRSGDVPLVFNAADHKRRRIDPGRPDYH